MLVLKRLFYKAEHVNVKLTWQLQYYRGHTIPHHYH
jgi:hypothetical protein